MESNNDLSVLKLNIFNDIYQNDFTVKDFPRIDGTGHNLSEPALGGIGTRYRQVTPTDYEDGISTPSGANRLGAREISNRIFAQTDPIPDKQGLSSYAWIFGQFINHEIDKAKLGTEPFPIPIPEDDPLATQDPQAFEFLQLVLGGFTRNDIDIDTGEPLRAAPAAQINLASSWIDGELIYGSNQERADFLRTFEGGELKTSEGDLLPLNDGRFEVDNFLGFRDPTNEFLAGDPRGNQQAGLTAMHIVWVREHNRLADQLDNAHPDWTDEQIYQRARAINIAQLQAITYNEYLPALLGTNQLLPYTGYDPNRKGGTNLTFATGAFRMGHSQVNDNFELWGPGNTRLPDLPLIDSFDVTNLFSNDPNLVDNILRGAAFQSAESVDTKLVENFRNAGSDQAALNIQRGRDHGLADYNTLRDSLNRLRSTLNETPLPPVTSFTEITSDPELQGELTEIYGDVNNIDMWVGMLAEDHLPGSSLGETAGEVIKLTFQRLRDADRFYYENPISNDLETSGLFTPEEIAELRQTQLSDIILRNTNIAPEELQENIFFAETPWDETFEMAGNDFI